MNTARLHDLLRQLRDGGETAVEVPVAEIRAELVRCDLDPDMLGSGAPDDVALLLEMLDGASVFGVLEGQVGLGVRDEAGPLDGVDAAWTGAERAMASAVRDEAGAAPQVDGRWGGAERQLLPAIRAESGAAAIADAVMRQVGVSAEDSEGRLLSGLLDNELDVDERARAVALLSSRPQAGLRLTGFANVGRQIREGVRGSAGAAPLMWAHVARAMGMDDPERVEGWDGAAFAAGVRGAAGHVDVVDRVMASLRIDVVAEPEIPAAANRGNWGSWSAVAGLAAAAALLLVALPALFGGPPEASFEPIDLQFAVAGEINVDQIRSGPDASVFVETPTGDAAPLIIWVDDAGGR